MEQDNKPVLVVDDDFAYGVKHGYYPELENDIHNDVIKVMSLNEARSSGKLHVQPSSDNENYYVYNPYIADKNYFLLDDPNLEREFGIAKTNAIKEALRRLGAKEVTISKVVQDATSTNTEGNLGGNKGPIGGDVNVNYERDSKNDFTLNIEFKDPSNHPSDYNSTKQYITTHGLAGDPFISEWLLVLNERGVITGQEKMNVTYFKEIQKALEIKAKISTPAFGVNAGFKNESKSTRMLQIELTVDFG